MINDYTQLYQHDPLIFEIYEHLIGSTRSLSDIAFHQPGSVMHSALEKKHLEELHMMQNKLWGALQARDATDGLRQTDIAGMIDRLKQVPIVTMYELGALKQQILVTEARTEILKSHYDM